jgi:predicted outer membrane repeat protein
LEARYAPAVLTVTNALDSGDGSLRAQIGAADYGDRIEFDDSLRGQTIRLTSGEIRIREGITIAGPGSDLLSVSGNAHSRVFNVADLTTVTIQDLTIRDGQSDFADGGGVLNAGTLFLDHCVLTNNSAGSFAGGGVANTGTLTLTDCMVTGNSGGNGAGVSSSPNATHRGLELTRCVISGNTSTANGGGVYSALFGFGLGAGDFHLIDSVVTDNTAALSGGGVYAQTSTLDETFQATVELTRCTVAGNRSASAAGIYLYASNQVQELLTDSTVADNIANGTAGGISSFTTTSGNARAFVVLTGCTVSGNQANNGGTGGGIYAVVGSSGTSQTTMTLTNCTVADNTADFAGGGLWLSLTGTAGVDLTNCTVAGNAATSVLGTGGGLASNSTFYSNVRLLNTIVAGNTATLGSNDVDQLVTSRGHNLIGRTDGSSGWGSSDLTGTDAGPLDARLGTLRDNGGPTQTMALLADSPALGAGTSMGAPATDQRGEVREGPPSIGAVEYAATAVDHFRVLAPAGVSAGDAFAVTVVAEDVYGNPVTNYAGTVYFVPSTGYASVPDPYPFAAADRGSHTFTGLAIYEAGGQSLAVTDGLVTGSADIAVAPLAAAYFEVTAPASVAAGTAFSVTVTARDQYGNVATAFTGTVSLGSTDPQAPDLGAHTFTAEEGGSFTLTGVTLFTPGPQTFYAYTDVLYGEAAVLVTPA